MSKESASKQGSLGPNERWSVRRKREDVLRLLRGEPLDALSRELGAAIYCLEQWREKAVLGIDEGLVFPFDAVCTGATGEDAGTASRQAWPEVGVFGWATSGSDPGRSEGLAVLGEGHRKVWARLKYVAGIAVSRKRVLRIMREHQLLSPYRLPQAPPNEHQGTITTDAPNVMWGVDGRKVLTVEEGTAWIFTAVEHWNAECMGCT